MELSDIDLNLLVLFQQLMVERRVSKVADNLGLTQPAVSNALAKLRRIFGDELFLRTSGGMVPTPFAEQLGESVGYALGMIHSGLNQRTQFTPATLKRTITIDDEGLIWCSVPLTFTRSKRAPASGNRGHESVSHRMPVDVRRQKP